MTERPSLSSEIRELMLRYVQLGQLLPQQPSEVLGDKDATQEAEMVLAEMAKVKSKIDARLACRQ
jgi:hypothetical protein